MNKGRIKNSDFYEIKKILIREQLPLLSDCLCPYAPPAAAMAGNDQWLESAVMAERRDRYYRSLNGVFRLTSWKKIIESILIHISSRILRPLRWVPPKAY